MTNDDAIRKFKVMQRGAGDETKEALDMAIKALEQEPCDDAISRADVKKYLSAPNEDGDRVIYEDDLDLLPPVTPQPRWISVSERLPEPNRLVLCYITTGATKTYFLAFWNDIQNDWEEGIGGCRLLRNDLEYEVTAWMPLPESYKKNNEFFNFDAPMVKNSEDAISRQAVMDCIDGYSQMIIRPIELKECIDKLPSVTPMQALEPCEDCISRKEVLDMATTIQTDDFSGNEIIEVVDVDDIKALPSVTPTRPRGKWTETSLTQVSGGDFNRGFKCSCCGYVTVVDDFNYCPNCGERMEGCS